MPVAKLGGKSKLGQDKEGKLGGELFSFCNGFIKEKLGLDIAAHVQETGSSCLRAIFEWSASHLLALASILARSRFRLGEF